MGHNFPQTSEYVAVNSKRQRRYFELILDPGSDGDFSDCDSSDSDL
jgi:hypothetical protein